MRLLFSLGSSFTPSSGLYATNNSVSNPANYTATQQVTLLIHWLYVQFKPGHSLNPPSWKLSHFPRSIWKPISSRSSCQSRSTMLQYMFSLSGQVNVICLIMLAQIKDEDFVRCSCYSIWEQEWFYSHAPTQLSSFKAAWRNKI